jgi:hypothetical protein
MPRLKSLMLTNDEREKLEAWARRPKKEANIPLAEAKKTVDAFFHSFKR